METPLLLALAVLGLVWAGSGVGLALLGHLPGPPVAAPALVIAGLATLGASVLDARGMPDAARMLFGLAWALALPLAVTCYPRLRWRHPVDFVALVAIVGSGVLNTVQPQRDAVSESSGVVIGCVLLLHTWWKLERADPRARRALTWVAVAGAAAALVGGVVTFAAPNLGGALVVVFAFALLGPAMVVGAARPEILDVRVVVVQVVVVATALISYVAAFTGLAALVELLIGRDPSIGGLALVGGLAALGVPPLLTALRGVVDELLFGARSDPLEAATHVAGHSAGEPVLALRAIREALALPYAVLRVEGAVVATSGRPGTSTRAVPLAVGEQQIGELEVGLRRGDVTLAPGDEHVLRLVAPLLALTARSAALATELQVAREQSVRDIEEERRRLRRDLHDGLGPRLSGIAFTADAARNSVRVDPPAAEALLAQLRADTTTAIVEIRELVYGMRPPALDELGLVQAIRQQALTMRTAAGEPLQVDLVAPQGLPALTAAVEVAAYRIAVEALTNAARHSGNDHATVRITASDAAIVVEVLDGGRGAAARWSAGVGTAGMQERAQELGGTVVVGPTPAGGRVAAHLPIGRRRSDIEHVDLGESRA